MRLKNKVYSALTLAKVKFLGKRVPLAVRFQLTNRCPSRCLYCNLWQMPSEELTTKQVFSILDELAEMGTKRISFSGGEPLLRDDLGKIIDCAVSKGISVSINTNGVKVPEKIRELKNLDLIKISIDGPRDINNKVRGYKQAYDWVISAAEAAQKQGIKFTFCTTLTRYNLTEYTSRKAKFNLSSIEFMVNLARKYKTMVAFQPLKTIYRGVKNISALYPTEEEWKKAIKELRILKKKYPKNIRNSFSLIDHIQNWPRYKKIPCWAGKIFCIIDVNGDVVPCDRVDYPTPHKASRGTVLTERIPNAVKLGFKEAFKRMPEARCSGCGFCGSMELNFLLSLKLGVLGEVKNLLESGCSSKRREHVPI